VFFWIGDTDGGGGSSVSCTGLTEVNLNDLAGDAGDLDEETGHPFGHTFYGVIIDYRV